MQNYFGKMTAEVWGPKQAQDSFVINGRATRQVCKLYCKCFENSLSTMLEKLKNFFFFTFFNVWESEIVACI